MVLELKQKLISFDKNLYISKAKCQFILSYINLSLFMLKYAFGENVNFYIGN